jgi:hypothetical protein
MAETMLVVVVTGVWSQDRRRDRAPVLARRISGSHAGPNA